MVVRLFWLLFYLVCKSPIFIRAAAARACMTTTGEPCIFPFKHDGISYDSCTTIDDIEDWCAISVKPDESVDERGFCLKTNPACSDDATPTPTPTPTPTTLSTSTQICTTNGEPCIFPFKHDDISYDTCTMIDDSEEWCATSVKTDGSVDGKGYCDTTVVSCSNAVTPTPQSTTTNIPAPQTNPAEVDWLKVFSHNASQTLFTVTRYFFK